jgi:uncharacterized membrane-anchored protein
LEKGGLALGTWGTSAALLALIIVGIAFGYRNIRAATPDGDSQPDLRELARD